jgi:hypothetical protein
VFVEVELVVVELTVSKFVAITFVKVGVSEKTYFTSPPVVVSTVKLEFVEEAKKV